MRHVGSMWRDAFGRHRARVRGDVESRDRPDGRNVDRRDRAGRTALHYASVEANLDEVATLITAGATVDAREDTGQYTPLMFAAQRDDNVDVVRTLLAAGAAVDLRNSKGETALYISTRSPAYGPGGADIIRCLLAHGADPHAPNARGDTPASFVKAVQDRFGRRAAFGRHLDEAPPSVDDYGDRMARGSR